MAELCFVLKVYSAQNTVDFFFQIQRHIAVNGERSRLAFNKEKKIKMDIPVANVALMLLYILSLGQWSLCFAEEVMDQVNSLKYFTSSS